MKKDLLWISLRVPYDNVPHAGGKTHNFYLKRFHASELFNMRLLSFGYSGEKNKLDLDEYGIKNEIFMLNKGKFNLWCRSILAKVGAPISLVEYISIRSKIKESLLKYRSEGYRPSCVVLQWTEIVMMLPFVKKLFPDAKIICIEEDVTFLKLMRKVDRANGFKSLFLKLQYHVLKRSELTGLKRADLVVLNNKKDLELVVKNGIDKGKSFIATPYFEEMYDAKRRVEGHDILFFGAMNRPENIETARLLINQILPKVLEQISDVRVILLGANPPQELQNLDNPYVYVTGFVDDVTTFFEKSYCLVAPLQMGAGIKIKILEGMSSGIPVITNSIGIEGIAAKKGVDYIHCESTNEFIEAVIDLMSDVRKSNEVGANGKAFMQNEFDKELVMQKFIKRVYQIIKDQ